MIEPPNHHLDRLHERDRRREWKDTAYCAVLVGLLLLVFWLTLG